MPVSHKPESRGFGPTLSKGNHTMKTESFIAPLLRPICTYKGDRDTDADWHRSAISRPDPFKLVHIRKIGRGRRNFQQYVAVFTEEGEAWQVDSTPLPDDWLQDTEWQYQPVHLSLFKSHSVKTVKNDDNWTGFKTVKNDDNWTGFKKDDRGIISTCPKCRTKLDLDHSHVSKLADTIQQANEEVTKGFMARMDQIDKEEHGDIENHHIQYDELLCDLLTQLGFGEIVSRFNESDKWYA